MDEIHRNMEIEKIVDQALEPSNAAALLYKCCVDCARIRIGKCLPRNRIRRQISVNVDLKDNVKAY